LRTYDAGDKTFAVGTNSNDARAGSYIDINDDHELYVWARTLGVTPDELARVVSEVGPSANHVRDALARERDGAPRAQLPGRRESD
jgi:hypothetical protein